MRIVRDFASCPALCKGAAVALGNFDGVHSGHQAILNEAIATARARSIPSAVMTFEPHPREFFAKDHKRLRITSFRNKIQTIAAMGIDTLFLVRFNERFAGLSPEAFVQDVLLDNLAVGHVVTGYNFAFGKNRRGDTAFLEQQSRILGFGFSACPAVQDAGGTAISSSAIRRYLADGNVKKASALLGRPYTIEGKVRHGRKQGRLLGFPTANLSLRNLFTPRFGVYAVRFSIEGQPNQSFTGVANLGVRPTFSQSEPLLEVHGFDMDKNMYGQHLSVELVEHIRDEQKFDGIEALKLQIANDCVRAKSLLQEMIHVRRNA